MSVEASVDPELALPAFCRYGLGVKFFLFLSVPFFLGVTAVLAWAVLFGNGNWIANVFGSALVLIALYAAWLAYRVVRFGNLELIVSETGLEILRGPGAARAYAWTDLALYRDRPLLQVFEISDAGGRTVVFVDCYLDNFPALRAATAARVKSARARAQARPVIGRGFRLPLPA
jgi:hypothetical protein